MQRGWKSALASLALDVRAEAGVKPTERLDPRTVATVYGFEVHPVSGCGLDAALLATFALSLADRWSGATVSDGHRVLILDNDFHPPGRRNATIAHEISHILLEHPLQSRVTYERSCGAGKAYEDEATELAGELLIPGDTIRRAAARGPISDQEVADHFAVSIVFARWRMNVSGARKMAARRRPRHG